MCNIGNYSVKLKTKHIPFSSFIDWKKLFFQYWHKIKMILHTFWSSITVHAITPTSRITSQHARRLAIATPHYANTRYCSVFNWRINLIVLSLLLFYIYVPTSFFLFFCLHLSSSLVFKMEITNIMWYHLGHCLVGGGWNFT